MTVLDAAEPPNRNRAGSISYQDEESESEEGLCEGPGKRYDGAACSLVKIVQFLSA